MSFPHPQFPHTFWIEPELLCARECHQFLGILVTFLILILLLFH